MRWQWRQGSLTRLLLVPAVFGISYPLMARWLRVWETIFIASAAIYGISRESSSFGARIAGGVVAGIVAMTSLMSFHHFYDADFEDEGLGLVGSLLFVAVPIGGRSGCDLRCDGLGALRWDFGCHGLGHR